MTSGPADIRSQGAAIQAAGLADPRLRAWRALLAAAVADALRRYQDAWAGPDLDVADRAVAAVGVLPTEPEVGLPALPGTGVLAALAAATGIGPSDEAVVAAAWWSAVDAQVAVAFGCAHDDSSRRYPSLGLLAQILAPLGLAVPLTIGAEHPLVTSGLLEPVIDADAPIRLPATTSALLAGQRPPTPRPEITTPRLATVVVEAAALITAGARVLVRCEAPDDRPLVRDAVAAHLGTGVAAIARPPAVAALLLLLRHELPAVVVDGEPVPPGATLALGLTHSSAPPGWHTLDVPPPSLDAAELSWRAALRRAGLRPSGPEIAGLAGRMPLPERTIAEVVAAAATAATVASRAPTLADVSAALRAHPPHDPGGLARLQKPGIRLDDLVLSEATRQALDDVISHARFSAAAHARIGLTGTRGRAVIALFHGPSGTGKTGAAEAVAAEIDRDLWVVDLAKVVSKWLGETQRNLDTVLSQAATAGAVLLFDEADGLFGKRGEVTDARDRYANLEIDHLLQRVEVHTGVVVLTSNRPAALDEAFSRRIRLAVRFDLPDHAQRKEIWRRYLPEPLLDQGTSPASAAREELSGAAIRSAAIAATVSAIAAGSRVRPGHLDAAVRRELEKSRRQPTARGGTR